MSWALRKRRNGGERQACRSVGKGAVAPVVTRRVLPVGGGLPVVVVVVVSDGGGEDEVTGSGMNICVPGGL